MMRQRFIFQERSSIALKSTEAELYAITLGAQEALFVQPILRELSYDGSKTTVKIFTDSIGAKAIADKKGLCGIRHMDVKVL